MSIAGTLRTRRYRERHRALGLCYNCPRRAVTNQTCCRKCLERIRQYGKLNTDKLRAVRNYRRLLGFCTHCKRLPLPGKGYCAKHQKIGLAATQRYRDKKKKARGWKLVRVKL